MYNRTQCQKHNILIFFIIWQWMEKKFKSILFSRSSNVIFLMSKTWSRGPRPETQNLKQFTRLLSELKTQILTE